jgi:hypothetical protein
MAYLVFANQPQGSRPTGRPKSRWWDCVNGDIRKCKIRNWEQRSKNREDWTRYIKEAKAHIGLYSQLRRRRRIRRWCVEIRRVARNTHVFRACTVK